MTSTHSGSPIPVAAAIANIDLLLKEKLTENAEAMGRILIPELHAIQKSIRTLSAVFKARDW